MTINKTDFAVIIEVKNANPNGDPLNGNRPRMDFNNIGEISDVCIKRKIRNRLQDNGNEIFVQSENRTTDGLNSLNERFNTLKINNNKPKNMTLIDRQNIAKQVCKKWLDVRLFGQLFAFKGSDLSLGVKGAVSIQSAYSVDPIEVIDTQITKSVNSETKSGRASDTIGMKYSVKYGVYVVYGSISSVSGEKNGITKKDLIEIKEALRTLFENDASSARPDGTMSVHEVYWWTHENSRGNASTKRVHESLSITLKPDITSPTNIDDYNIHVNDIDGVNLEIIQGY